MSFVRLDSFIVNVCLGRFDQLVDDRVRAMSDKDNRWPGEAYHVNRNRALADTINV